MNSITAVINVILGSGRKYQISSEIPLDECDTLQKLNNYCLQLVNIPNYYVTQLQINDNEVTDEDYTVQLTDDVKMTVSEMEKPTSISTVPSSSTPLHIELPVASSTTSTTASDEHTSARISDSCTTPSTSDNCVATLRPFTYYDLIPANDYLDWITINAARINDCYKCCIPNKGFKYAGKDLYDYFNESSSKPVIVLCGVLFDENRRTGLCNRLLMQDTEEQLLKALATFLHHVYPSYDIYSSGINTFLTLMTTWLEYPIFSEWAQLSSKSRLHKMIKKRRCYQTSSGRKIPVPTFTAADQTAIDQLAITLRNSSTEEVEGHLRDNLHLRKSWVAKLCADPELERGIATVFFQKFPVFNTRLELLHMDFEFTMQRMFNFVPDLTATLKKYASTILYTATTHSVEVLTGEQDECFKAVNALPALVKKFAPRGRQQTLNHLFTVTNNLNINAALTQRMTYTTSPSLIATNWGERITFYVAVDDFALHTSSTNIAEAMQRLFEVYYALDLAYDVHMKDLFELLECLMDMKPNAGVGVKKLTVAIKHFYEQPPNDFQQIIDASEDDAPTATTTSEDNADPFAGLPLTPDSSQDLFDESTVDASLHNTQHTERGINTSQEQENNENDIARHKLLQGTEFITPHRSSQSTNSTTDSNHNRGYSSTRSRVMQRTSSSRTPLSTTTPIPSQERVQQSITSTPIARRPSSNSGEPRPKRSRGRPRKSTVTIRS